MRLAIVAVASAGALLIGCGGAEQELPDSGRGTSGVDCARLGPKPASATVVADRVAFARPAGTAQGAPLQTASAEDGRSFAKVGLFVRGNARVQLRLASDVPGSVDIWWDTKRPARAVVLRQRLSGACADLRWTGHAGGILFDGELCLPLLVEVGGQRRTVTFGLKRDCSSA